MIKVSVYKQGSYPVSTKKIKKAVGDALKNHGITSDSEVSVALVSEKKMNKLVKKYYKKDKGKHPVLSFPNREIKEQFSFPPDRTPHLGEIIISYKQAVEQAKKSGKLIEEVICDLASHGAKHLMGIHHS